MVDYAGGVVGILLVEVEPLREQDLDTLVHSLDCLPGPPLCLRPLVSVLQDGDLPRPGDGGAF